MTWLKHHLPHLAAILGLALVVAGVSLYSWPAGLIVAGIGLLLDALHGLAYRRKQEQDE
jgi:hypothetical protein